MKDQYFVVFAYGGDRSHMVNSPEVVIIKGEEYLSVYTSHRPYVDSKRIAYDKIQSEMANIVDNGGVLVLKNTDEYGINAAWTELGKSNPTDMVKQIEDHIFDIDNELKNILEHSANLQDALGPTLGEKYSLHTERYAPVWQKGSKDTIIAQCIEDATIILNLVNHCRGAGLINVRSRRTGVIKGVDVEW